MIYGLLQILPWTKPNLALHRHNLHKERWYLQWFVYYFLKYNNMERERVIVVEEIIAK